MKIERNRPVANSAPAARASSATIAPAASNLSAPGPPADPVRQGKLDKFLASVLSGARTPQTQRDGNLLIEAICAQADRAICFNKLLSSPQGLPSVQACMRFNTALPFLNGPAVSLLTYLQDPALKQICEGDYLRQVLLAIVHPPFFWDAFVKAYREVVLSVEAQRCFGWLLLELLSLPSEKAAAYYTIAQEDAIQTALLGSKDFAIRTIGQKIKHVLSTLGDAVAVDEYGNSAGGRHDNDFADFRKISIMPSADELTSTEPPFLRSAQAFEDPELGEKRLAVYLDNQYRLLREDMLGEVREELQIALNMKKGRHRGTVVEGFKIDGIELGDATDRKFDPWRLRLQCLKDIPGFPSAKKAATQSERKTWLETYERRNLFKHQGLFCLIIDDEIVAFPTCIRDTNFLSRIPPVVILQFSGVGEASTTKALLKLKIAKKIKLVQMDTAVFSFEPILQRLQEIKEVPLEDELVLWEPGDPMNEPPNAPFDIIDEISLDPTQNLQSLLNTPKAINLDGSQSASLLMGLSQRVSLIQGPPGTGKSFIGALIAKAIYGDTASTILVVCYTNHALDQFLEDLLDIGIPEVAMVRLGGKSTDRTKPLSLYEQRSTYRLGRDDWDVINSLKGKAANLSARLQTQFQRYQGLSIHGTELLQYLEFEDPIFYQAFEVPDSEDGWNIVDERGHAVKKTYLIDRWMAGNEPGVFTNHILGLGPDTTRIWYMTPPERVATYEKWQLELLKEECAEFYTLAEQYNKIEQTLDRIMGEKNIQLIKSKRIVGCTTTAAAKYSREIQAAAANVLLVEEAGEILESHIITALGPQTKQLILIGDHKQLRPKVNNYALTVEKGNGYDLNRSLFERLVLKGFPHQTLNVQHRMRPEISSLVRELTYPDLVDAPSTMNRPNVRGFSDNVIFVDHAFPEDEDLQLAANQSSSKSNKHEVAMIIKAVKYLAQQGYGTDKLVVLTPYLGQLQLLRKTLAADALFDPVLSDLDSYDLVRAGLLPAASALVTKNPLLISSIDNYQGDERDIVLVTMTRSNQKHDIGFMSSPERLNVLLSRARLGLIMIGNSETFLKARNGREVWVKFFELLRQGGHVHNGFPLKCEQHPTRTVLLSRAVDFEEECPDGGCKEPCGTMLSCNLHTCPQKCHNLSDHSKMQCQAILQDACANGHTRNWKCFQKAPVACQKCEADARKAEKKKQQEFELQQKRDEEVRDHQREMAALDEKIDKQRQALKDAHAKREREQARQQKLKDLADSEDMVRRALKNPPKLLKPSESVATIGISLAGLSKTTPLPASGSSGKVSPISSSSSGRSSGGGVPLNAGGPNWGGPYEDELSGGETSGSSTPRNSTPTLSGAAQPPQPPPTSYVPKPFIRDDSPSEKEWQRQKDVENVENRAIDALMDMIGLEDVKSQILKIKAKVDTTLRQGTDLKDERFSISFLGNPGTGKTTVARIYAQFLKMMDVLPGIAFMETTGARLANEGVAGVKKQLEDIIKAGGGVLFIDEAYQLTQKQNHGGAAVLDFLLAEIENNVGKIVFILAGYNKEMEAFFEHNPGLTSRIPYTLQFADYKDDQLLQILQKTIVKKYKGRMQVEGGLDGLYMRVSIRRLGRGRGRPGYGNARALQNVFAKITERQGERLNRERKDGLQPDDFYLTKEDLIGPDPSKAMVESKSWKRLQTLIGLETVKDSVKSMFDLIITNYKRELCEKEPIEMSLNRVFLGSPGTGKTSVAKHYGQILADLGLLSNGEVVVKNPSDFVGAHLGESEANTKAILATTVGKVLIIDEAYMLYSGGKDGLHTNNDTFKTAVIDTIVAEVQSVPGDDRCVLLLGYEEEMKAMFQNVNPGLSRRFAIEDAFYFQDFTAPQLRQILDLKMKDQELDATEDAKVVFDEVIGRSRRRPNFGNAGEVENILGKAKISFQSRQSKKPPAQREVDVLFQPQDFDVDFNRGKNAATNCRKLFEDVIGSEAVVAKLEGYQQIAANMKAAGLDPHEEIPTNFVFKGPPGTGKTTTARKVGQVFYDMGFLSSPNVKECSATDLIGQYVGQTGPKVQKKLEEALGQVLFIDEAYRLGGGSHAGHFAQEAVDELVDCITKPKFASKLVIILAGYDQDMNRLMGANSGLSSRFPEEIVFENMSALHCMQLLEKDLKKKKINCPTLQNPDSPAFKKGIDILDRLSLVPGWGNARDVKNLAKKMIGAVFKTPRSKRTLSADDFLGHLRTMLDDKQERAANLPSTNFSKIPALPPMTRQPPNPPSVSTNTSTAAKKAEPKPPTVTNPAESRNESNERDDGVSDEAWNQLQADKAAEKERDRLAAEAIAKQEREAEAALRAQKAAEDALAAAAQALAKAKEDAEREELKRKHEAARLAEQRQRIAREKARAELERRRQMEEERKKKEAKAQQKLRQMGVCCAGYRWIKQASGYRCAGGSHYVSDSQLGM